MPGPAIIKPSAFTRTDKTAVAKELIAMLSEQKAEVTEFFSYPAGGPKSGMMSREDFIAAKWATPEQKKETEDAGHALSTGALQVWWNEIRAIAKDAEVDASTKADLKNAADQLNDLIGDKHFEMWGSRPTMPLENLGPTLDLNTATRADAEKAVKVRRDALHAECGFRADNEAALEPAVLARQKRILDLFQDKTPEGKSSEDNVESKAGNEEVAGKGKAEELEAGPGEVRMPERIPQEQESLLIDATQTTFAATTGMKTREALEAALTKMTDKEGVLATAVTVLTKTGATATDGDKIRRARNGVTGAQAEVRTVLGAVTEELEGRREALVDTALVGIPLMVSELSNELGAGDEAQDYKPKLDALGHATETDVKRPSPSDPAVMVPLTYSIADLKWAQEEIITLGKGNKEQKRHSYVHFLKRAEKLGALNDPEATTTIDGKTYTTEQLENMARDLKQQRQRLSAAVDVITSKRAEAAGVLEGDSPEANKTYKVITTTLETIAADNKHARLVIVDALRTVGIDLKDRDVEVDLRANAQTAWKWQDVELESLSVNRRVKAALRNATVRFKNFWKGTSVEELDLEARAGTIKAAQTLLKEVMTMPELRYQLAGIEPLTEQERQKAFRAEIRGSSAAASPSTSSAAAASA